MKTFPLQRLIPVRDLWATVALKVVGAWNRKVETLEEQRTAIVESLKLFHAADQRGVGLTLLMCPAGCSLYDGRNVIRNNNVL